MTIEYSLNKRSQQFLKVLIEQYIEEGAPVGSRALSQSPEIKSSPATIRNVMSDLESLGLIKSPHVSAGRVPTIAGYRLFVDTLLQLEKPNLKAIEQLTKTMAHEVDSSKLLETASTVLSRFTHMASVVTLPKREQVIFQQIEFLPLSANRVLVILVSSDGEVHNRVIEPPRNYSASELVEAANQLNACYAGMDFLSLRTLLIKEMTKVQSDMDQVMSRAVKMASKALSDQDSNDDLMMAGQTNLMDFDELSELHRLRRLFDSFKEKNELLHLLDRCSNAEGVQIFIGAESGYEPLRRCSLVSAPYSVDGQLAGVLGVIGPTRMAYQHVVPMVNVTAKILSQALKIGN